MPTCGFSDVKKMLTTQDIDHELLSGYANYTPSGKPRYLLFYGIYSNSHGAPQSAIENMPSRLKANQTLATNHRQCS